MLGVDDKLLPDSMKADEFGKFIEDQKGKLFGNPEDFKNLQKIISKKDVDFRKTKEALEKLKDNKNNKNNNQKTESEKLIEKLNEKLSSVEKKFDEMQKTNRTEELKKQYPDIVPELLIGKENDEIEKIVESQRAMTKKLYGDSKQFAGPNYNDIDDIKKEMDEVNADQSMSGDKKAVKILQLNKTLQEFSESATE